MSSIIVEVPGPPGSMGPSPNLSIGQVLSATDGNAAVTITGSSPNYVLNFALPPGPSGPGNQLTIGTVTTGAAGTDADAHITGTAPVQTLHLTIPQGLKGSTGATGPANTLAIGTVTGLAAGATPTATITGTAPSQTLNLGIPAGATGASNSLAIGTVTTLAAGSSATATITGTAPNQTLSLGIPQGPTGAGSPDATATAKGSIKLAGDLSGTADAPVVNSAGDRAYVRSFAATDLIANGTGYLGNNTNFSMFTFTPADSPVGGGSFLTNVGDIVTYFNDELLPVDLSRKYLLSLQVRQSVTGQTAYFYAGLWPFDSTGTSIGPGNYMHQNNTTTTLAAPLAPGATTITLTSAANWNNAAAANTYLRRVIVWDWVDSFGKLWPVQTYSRHVSPVSLYADGGINFGTNTITLSAPFDPVTWGYPAGTTIPSGTPVSNGSSGGTYMYGTTMQNVQAPAAWAQYQSTFASGQMPITNGGRTAADSTSGFPPGTAFVKFILLPNRQAGSGASVPASALAISSVSFSDATYSQFDLNSATSSNSNNTLVRRSAAGAIGSQRFTIGSASPTTVDEATRKDYVDGQDAAFRRRGVKSTGVTSYTLTLADEGTVLYYSGAASPVAWTIPTNAVAAFPVGSWVDIMAGGTGVNTITPSATVTLLGTDGLSTSSITTRSDYSTIRLYKYATDKWVASGDINNATAQAVTSATSTATGSMIIKRDTAGRASVADPSASTDISTKNYVDNKTWAIGSISATGTASASTYLRGDGTWATPGGAASATTTSLGVVQLAGDLAGTATAPTVPGLTSKVGTTRLISAGTGLTGGGDLSVDRTLSVSYGTIAGTATQGNDTRVVNAVQTTDVRVIADQAAGTASIRTIGTGALQAAAGNHTHTSTALTDATTVGRAVLTSATAAAARTAIGSAVEMTFTATKVAAYTAAAGEIAVMNVSGGGTVLNLPAAPANGTQVGFWALGSTTAVPLTVNRGGTTDTIGSAGATSVTEPLSGVTRVFKYDSANTRWVPFTDVKPLTALDGRFAALVHTHTSSQISDATSASTASRVIVRDANGRASVVDPSASTDIATKNYVDTRAPKITVGATAPSSPAINDVWIDAS